MQNNDHGATLAVLEETLDYYGECLLLDHLDGIDAPECFDLVLRLYRMSAVLDRARRRVSQKAYDALGTEAAAETAA